MSIEAAAEKMNEQGWTCTAHEPDRFGSCVTCKTQQLDAVRQIIAAWAGDRVLYVASRQLDTPCRHQHITNVREVYQGSEYQGNDFDVCEVQSAFVQVWPSTDPTSDRCCESDQHPQHHHHDITHAHKYYKLDHVHNMDELPTDKEMTDVR